MKQTIDYAGKVIIALLIFTCIANANYMIHLKYDNGNVVQDGVYYTNAASVTSNDGNLNVTVGSYETSFTFPLVIMHDYSYNQTGGNESAPSPIEIVKTADVYVVVPEVPQGTNVVVNNETTVLLNEPIKKAVELEPKPASNVTQTGTTGTPKNETSTKGGPCLISYIIPAIGASAWYMKRKENA